MLRFDGEDYVWNGTPVQKLKVDELSDSDRFEFLCAIYAHDPIFIEMASGCAWKNVSSSGS
ncbi:hypothetical protein VSR68_29700 [Paraburkholderia phymatum]|uniref:hypothetical protein n=1 Tax=Paraburkholderia phymatum TaxID=148447 RepID=UPI00317E6101